MSEAKTTRQRAPRKRDREVVDAAARVFFRKGYADATVQDVADELGILKGSLYHYIDTKEDLLYRLFEEVHVDVEQIREQVAAAEVEPLERLRLYVERQILYNLANHERISIYYHEVDHLTGERADAFRAKRRATDRFVVDTLKAAQEAGQADAGMDARLMANCIFATIIWTYRWYKPGGRYSRDSIARTASQFVLGGVTGALAA
jgi:TetR/AcrR family transcriptional regulator, cholesterol catabolism regulator